MTTDPTKAALRALVTASQEYIIVRNHSCLEFLRLTIAAAEAVLNQPTSAPVSSTRPACRAGEAGEKPTGGTTLPEEPDVKGTPADSGNEGQSESSPASPAISLWDMTDDQVDDWFAGRRKVSEQWHKDYIARRKHAPKPNAESLRAVAGDAEDKLFQKLKLKSDLFDYLCWLEDHCAFRTAAEEGTK
jgi:hypothetical protein